MNGHLTKDEILTVVVDGVKPRCSCFACKDRVAQLSSLLTTDSETPRDFSIDVLKQIKREKASSADALLRETFLCLASGAILFFGAVLLFGSSHGDPMMRLLATDACAVYGRKIFTNERFLYALLGNPLTVVSVLVGVILLFRAIVAYAHEERFAELLALSFLAFSIKPLLSFGLDLLTVSEQISYRAFNAAAFSLVAESVLLFWLFASGYSVRQLQRSLAESFGFTGSSSSSPKLS